MDEGMGRQASIMFRLLRYIDEGTFVLQNPDVCLRITLCGRRFLAFRWRNAVREAVRLDRSLGFRLVGPVLRLARGARAVPARLNPTRLAQSAALSGGVRQKKGLTRTLPCIDAKASAFFILYFSVATQKKTLRDPARKWPMDTKAKGLLYTLCLACFSKKIKPLRDLGVGLRARTRRSRGPGFKGRRSLTSSESAPLTQRALTRTP